jgi:hypothetical protein
MLNRIPRRREIEIYVFLFWRPKKEINKTVEVEDTSESRRDFAVLHVNLIYIPGSENNIRKHWKVLTGIKHMDHEAKTIGNIVGLSNRRSGGI